MTSPSTTPDSKLKLDAEKIKNEIARVNIIEVLLFRLRWPSRFLLMTSFSRLSLLQQVAISRDKNPFSTNSKMSTEMNVSPIIIMIKSESKINKNH
jgi:hypothetical protein